MLKLNENFQPISVETLVYLIIIPLPTQAIIPVVHLSQIVQVIIFYSI